MNRGSGRSAAHAAPVAPERGRNAHIATFNNECGHSGRTDCGAMETTGEDGAALMGDGEEAVVVVEGKQEGEEERKEGRREERQAEEELTFLADCRGGSRDRKDFDLSQGEGVARPGNGTGLGTVRIVI